MDDDLQIDSDEDLFRNPVYYEPAGRDLDLDRADLGVPQGQNLLRMRGRVPVEKPLPGPEGLPEHFSCRTKHEA